MFDGGSLGNPGKGYGSYLLVNPAGVEKSKALEFESSGVTSNQAEYRTLIDALDTLAEMLGPRSSCEHVRVEGDSQLVLNQLTGKWKVKNVGLKPLFAEATEQTNRFATVAFQWHPRERSVRILGH